MTNLNTISDRLLLYTQIIKEQITGKSSVKYRGTKVWNRQPENLSKNLIDYSEKSVKIYIIYSIIYSNKT